MPRKPAAADAPPAVDPTSSAIVLAYAGDGRSARNVPARHLSAADLARLAYRRALADTAADGIRPDPRHPDADMVAQLLAELTRFGIYSADPAAIAAAAAELAGDPAIDPAGDAGSSEG